MIVEDIETPNQVDKMDSVLDSCIDLDPRGVEKSIFQQVANNLYFHLEEINLRELEIDKDQT